ncbi:MAG TPA: hypothetical protein VM287_04660, partial [Egibacteraceae bacterium]|nr:hypothetical protein [Egibacteraceae bacterium]
MTRPVAYQAGTAFLPIRPSMRGFHSEIRSELRRINPVVEVRVRPVYDQFRPPPIPDQTVRIRAEVDNRSLSAAVVHVAAFGRALGQLALPVALVAAAPQIASIGAAAVATSGALGLIPATAGAAALAVGTLAVGFAHMGDALGPAGTPAQLKKVNEALAQLSPNARATAVVIRGLGDEWKSLRLTVQDNLFAGVAGHVSQLAGIYLPMLSAAMAGVAASFNAAAREVFGFLATRSATGDYASGLGSIETAIGNLSGAARPLTQAFTDIFVVGAGFLPGFGQSIADISSRFARFVSTARETGQLASWIQEGISTLGTLGSVAGNVGGILGTVFKAAQTAGMDTLRSVDMLTQRLNTFLSTGVGNRAIVTLFTTINQVVTALLPGLEAVASAISLGIIALGPSLQPLAASFSEIAIAVAPLISDLSLLAAAILPPLASVLSTISPLLGPIAAGLIAMYAVQYLTGMYIAASAAITAFAAANMSQAAAMAFAGGIMSKLRGVVLLLNAAFWANPIGIVVLALAGLAAALVFAYRHSETFRNIVQGAWQGIQVAVAVAWQWLQVAFAGFMQAMTAIGNAATWLWTNALAPAWTGIVAATNAVGAAFSWLWTSVIQPVFSFIDTAARVLVAVLVTIVLTPIILTVKAVGAAVMWLWTNAVQPAWQGIQAAISAAWNFIRDNIFNPIVEFLTGVLAPAWNVYRALVVTVWNTIRDGIAAAWAFIRDAIFNPIMSFLAGVFTAAWNNLRANITAAWNAIQAAISAAWNFIRDVIFNPIIAFIQGPLTGGFNAGRDAATAAWNTIRNNLNTVWVFVRDNIFTPLTNFVSQTIPQAFDRAVSAIRTAWNQIREIAAAPVRFMVNTV